MRAAPLIAHRFGRSLGPDSSRTALERLDWTTVVGVETDCCLTADGEIVLLHDDLLDDATDLAGWAHQRPLDEIARSRLRAANGELTADSPLSLAEGLDVVDANASVVQLEVKATMDGELACATTAALTNRADVQAMAERLEIISFWPAAVEAAAHAGFRARLIVAAAYVPEALVRWAQRFGVTGVILEAHYWSEDVVRLWRSAGLSIASGVVNSPILLKRLMEFEPDLVATDRPHELHAVISSDELT
jgi:glycerophosphoryl diester phosphodiesterase